MSTTPVKISTSIGSIQLDHRPEETIHDLKSKIWEKNKFPVEQQRIRSPDSSVSDSQLISEFAQKGYRLCLEMDNIDRKEGLAQDIGDIKIADGSKASVGTFLMPGGTTILKSQTIKGVHCTKNSLATVGFVIGPSHNYDATEETSK
ncbi:hypothetical protein B0J11DRAFT_611367 [Dendryphion nanum]|uniref:Ubiquitin-like domain-containing protein n=1 Tax=Dendryphion nanum TaxID=256645 RepID=A0A9P9EA21_9PLEO|nr:hypothetical protein B0J11DRAFT_611367 [Dendryphion nanum]